MSKIDLLWKPVPDQRPLGASDVHIRAADLDKCAAHLASLQQALSPDELDRAQRFKFETDRNRFIAGRGLLRAILGSYTQTAPAQLSFAYNQRGKPTLNDIPGQGALHFNVAHSKDLILIAVTRACAVGIDVEWIRPMDDAEDIAARFFSARETALLMALPKDRRTGAFFSLWTRKEAWLKATGDGLSEMLNQVEVSCMPNELARVLAISGNVDAARRWTLQDLAPAPGFAAAIAVEGKGLQISCSQWP